MSEVEAARGRLCNLSLGGGALRVLGAPTAATRELQLSAEGVTIALAAGTLSFRWRDVADEGPILYLTHRAGMSKKRRFVIALCGLIATGSGVTFEEEGTCYLDLGRHGCFDLGNPLKDCDRRQAQVPPRWMSFASLRARCVWRRDWAATRRPLSAASIAVGEPTKSTSP
ncbi:MAG TPA: hypothetical protein VNU26_18020 [Mycobacteriales bacterium]|nr:hypothetical protein [Mycobacteriales bacterium]